MADLAAVAAMELEGTKFTSTLTPPRSGKTLFLGGAGVRGLHINGKFKVFTLSAVYMESGAISFLSRKWQGKSVEQLSSSTQFFQDIISGPFDKLLQITLVERLGGTQYAQKVVEHCTEILKNWCLYSRKEEEAAEEFVDVFRGRDLPPGSSIFFAFCTSGQLVVAFSEDSSVPEVESRVIDCQNLTQAILESAIGEGGVSPAAKLSIASRLHNIINEHGCLDVVSP